MNFQPQTIISPILPVLDELRRDIDQIDDHLLDLLEQRYAVVKRIAWAKTGEAERALAVRPAREAAIMERLLARASHVPQADVALVWRSILALSSCHQRTYRLLLWGEETARPALLRHAAARYPGINVECLDDLGHAVEAADSGEAILLVASGIWDQVRHCGLDLIGQHPTGCAEQAWVLELGRLSREEEPGGGWSRDSGRPKVHRQMPAYPDERLAGAIPEELANGSGIVPPHETSDLRARVAEAQGSRAVLIQTGDCAERMDADAEDVCAMTVLIDRLGAELETRLALPAIRVGRLGGQHAKPRSQPTEGDGSARVPAYRGDGTNGPSACPLDRRRDGGSLVTAASARVVAYLGGHGSFSEQACRRFMPAHDLMPLDDFASVARAVCEGSADLALLPTSNSRVGPITAVRTLLAHPELCVIGEEVLGVRLHLLGCSGTELGSITHVSSHPAALVQCEAYLAAQAWTVTPCESTAEAARRLALSQDPSQAAIASEEAAAIYGLEVLARDLQGQAENVTSFAIVERRNQFA